jgi:hypothetical protein
MHWLAVACQVSAENRGLARGFSFPSNLALLPGADWAGQFSAQVKFKLTATDSAAVAGEQ